MKQVAPVAELQDDFGGLMEGHCPVEPYQVGVGTGVSQHV